MNNLFNSQSDLFLIKFFRYLFLFSIIIIGLSCFYCDSYAMKPSCYSYKAIKEKLPKDLQTSTYIYEADGVAKIALGTYKETGTDYRTSMKHSGDTLYYCIDYNSHFTDDKDYINNNTMYSDELRARIGLAIHLGTSKWNTKASSGYTTGNFVKDYFMTQMVIHGLIYKYGGNLKNNGVDFSSIKFKDGTDNLESKTKALYKTCCKSIFVDDSGSFQSIVFKFDKNNHSFVLNDDATAMTSDLIACNVSNDNASINQFLRTSHLYNSANTEMTLDVAVSSSNDYNSSFNFNITTAYLDTLQPDVYTAKIEQTTSFHRALAKEYLCSTNGFTDNQAVIGYATSDVNVSDDYSLSFYFGKVQLVKKDSITGEFIEDAAFEVLQYDNTIGDYVKYKDLIYDANLQKYISGNLYISSHNPEAKFKVIESSAGGNHIKDWNGQEFVISPDNLIIEIEAENSPILGKLQLHKDGKTFDYLKDKQIFQKKDDIISLPNVKFDLFAKEDIAVKDKIIYKKDQKIVNITTDNKGDAIVDKLLPGKYYLKESYTDPLYHLDPDNKEFEIKKEDGLFKDVSYTFVNELKNCKIELFKYTSEINNNNDITNNIINNNTINNNTNDNTNDKSNNKTNTQDKKIPLSGCKFGLYSKNDIKDITGKVIVNKDTLLMNISTDKNGKASFDNLLYADYYIKELEVPNGIVLNDKVYDVTKDSFTLKSGTTKEYEKKLDIFNEKQPYVIKLMKNGERFCSASIKNNENGSFYEYATDYSPLKGASYTLYNSKDEKLTTKTSDDKGIIEFGPLEYGDYYCVEQTAPIDHIIDKKTVKFSCTQLKKKEESASTTVNETNKSTDKKTESIIVEQSVNDDYCSCSLNILKIGEITMAKDKKLVSQYVPLSGVVFGLYQDFEYTFPSGDKLPVNTCLGYITTDETGKGTFNGKLPQGNYHLLELKTLNGYDIDETPHQFTVSANNNNNISIDLTNDPYRNELSKSGVKIIKKDSDTGKKLKGVQFTLYDSFKNEIGVYTTDKNGEITVDNLPYGNYYFIETKSRKGYYSSNNKYSFTLDSKEYKKLEISNTPILKLGFEEHYKLFFIVLSLVIIICGIYIFKYDKSFKKTN